MKRFISCLMTVLMLVSAMVFSLSSENKLPFEDVKDKHWFCESVKYCYEKGLMSGLSDTVFDPNGKMTRAMFITILARLSGQELKNAESFRDVKKSDWFSKYVGWAEKTGVVAGYEDGTFKPNNPITRQEAAVALMRYVTYIGKIMPTDKDAPLEFTDKEKIASWASSYVSSLRRYGFIKGDADANFNPKGNLSRAESATILMRMHQTYEEITMEEPVALDYYSASADAYVLGPQHLYNSGIALTSSYDDFEIKDGALWGKEEGRNYTQFYDPLPNGYASAFSGNYISLDLKLLNIPIETYKYVSVGIKGSGITHAGIDGYIFSGSLVFSSEGGRILCNITDAENYDKKADEIKLTLLSDGDFGIEYIALFKDEASAKAFDAETYKGIIGSYKGYDITYAEMDKTVLDGYMKQIDGRKTEILSAVDLDPKTVKGQCWYVSSVRGSDSNDGLSPSSPFKTPKGLYTFKGNGTVVIPKPKSGDAVFFERGSMFYPEDGIDDTLFHCINAVNGVSYSAYGKGEMPVFTSQMKFDGGSETGTWTPVPGTEYVYSLDTKIEKAKTVMPSGRTAYREICSICFDDGSLYGIRIETADRENPIGSKTISDYGWTTNGRDSIREDSMVFEGPQSLVNDLEYWVDYNTGTLYLCSVNGNPGEIFSEIHAARTCDAFVNGIDASSAKNVTVRNISFRWLGSGGISVSDAQDFRIEYCDFEWIGGCTDGNARLGNAVQNWGGCDGFYCDNCYINQVYDTGITTQGGNGSMINISFSGNVIERCNMNIEIFNGVNDDDKLDCLVNVRIADNFERYAGYSFGHQRGEGNKTGTFYLGSKGNEVFVSNFVVENNICLYAAYFTAAESYVACGEKCEGEIFRNNVYLMSRERGYCFRARHNIAGEAYAAEGKDYRKTLLPYTERYVQYLADMGIERGSKFYYYDGYIDIFPQEINGVFRDN